MSCATDSKLACEPNTAPKDRLRVLLERFVAQLSLSNFLYPLWRRTASRCKVNKAAGSSPGARETQLATIRRLEAISISADAQSEEPCEFVRNRTRNSNVQSQEPRGDTRAPQTKVSQEMQNEANELSSGAARDKRREMLPTSLPRQSQQASRAHAHKHKHQHKRKRKRKHSLQHLTLALESLAIFRFSTDDRAAGSGSSAHKLAFGTPI